MRTKQEAIRFLTARWHEQCEQFPHMRENIPLALYISRNLDAAMRNKPKARDHEAPTGLFGDRSQLDLADRKDMGGQDRESYSDDQDRDSYTVGE